MSRHADPRKETKTMNQKTTIQKIQLKAALSFCEHLIAQLTREQIKLQTKLAELDNDNP